MTYGSFIRRGGTASLASSVMWGTNCCMSSAFFLHIFWKECMLGVSYSSLSSSLE